MTDPWRIYMLFSDTGTIRKWDVKPFEIDGVRATEFHAVSVHGLHTCSDTCDRPLCVARREIERLREAVEKAASQFEYYERSHRQKGTHEAEAKARTNGLFALEMRQALNQETDQ